MSLVQGIADGFSRLMQACNALFDFVTSMGSRIAIIESRYPVSSANGWTMRNAAASNSWNSVCYGNGLFVAVANSGTGNRVMTSPDGVTWTARTSAADNNWNSVCYGNGLFVAVASSGTGNRVMTSPDGVTWTSRTSAADNNWNSVCYGNGLFVAVANSGTGNRVMTSPDGITWTARTSAADNAWRYVCFGNGLFVAVAASGTGNRVMTSPDGVTWTARTSAADNNWYSVCYGNGIFVAVAVSGTGNRVMTSLDGVTWTTRTPAIDNNWNSVCYGNGLFVAISTYASTLNVMTSPDGVTWTIQTGGAANEGWDAVCYGNGMFVAVASSGTNGQAMSCSGSVVDSLEAVSVSLVSGGVKASVFSGLIANRPLLKIRRYPEYETFLQPSIWRKKIARWNAAPGVTTVPGVDGLGALTAVGTATARTILATNIATRARRMAYVSAATAGSLCGVYSPVALCTVASGSTGSGFFFSCRFVFADTNTAGASAVAGSRGFIGLSSSLAAPTNVDPATLTNCIGIAQRGDVNSNFWIVFGGSAAQTPIDLGADFSAALQLSNVIEVTIFSPVYDTTNLYYRVELVGTSIAVEGKISGTAGTTFPASTTLLAPRAWRTNNATAAAVELDISSIYLETDV